MLKNLPRKYQLSKLQFVVKITISLLPTLFIMMLSYIMASIHGAGYDRCNIESRYLQCGFRQAEWFKAETYFEL